MAPKTIAASRVHLLAHANPLANDLARLGLDDPDEYVAFVRRHLPKPLKLTCDPRVLAAAEEPWRAGRRDDALRIRDIQAALDDPRTLAIVAASGGAYFARLLPHLDVTPLSRRREPLWALGFSELSTLVNLVASHPAGRGLYWLGPNWLGWRLQPPEAARAALGEFWRVLPDLLAGRLPAGAHHLDFGPVRGELVRGALRPGRIRIVGGCLSVLAAAVGGRIGRRLRPGRRWLALEDIKEAPYRIDRHLAALKIAGWFEQVRGILVGDFRMMNTDTQPAVLDLLDYHLPAGRPVPVVVTRSFGHVWPMVPVLLNRPVRLELDGSRVTIWAAGLAEAGGPRARVRAAARAPRGAAP